MLFKTSEFGDILKVILSPHLNGHLRMPNELDNVALNIFQYIHGCCLSGLKDETSHIF